MSNILVVLPQTVLRDKEVSLHPHLYKLNQSKKSIEKMNEGCETKNQTNIDLIQSVQNETCVCEEVLTLVNLYSSSATTLLLLPYVSQDQTVFLLPWFGNDFLFM